MDPSDYERIESSLREACDEQNYQRAATAAVEAYGGELLAFLVTRLKDRSAAEEVLAAVFEKLWVGLPEFKWRCPLRAWAYRLARNAANDYVKAAPNQAGRRVTLSRHPSKHPLAPDQRTTTARFRKTASKDRMRELRERLPPDDQMLLILRVDKELSFRELAVALGEGPLDEDALQRQGAHLRKRFERIKATLRQMAHAEGVI